MKQFNVWFMNINPQGGYPQYNRHKAFEYCKQNKIIGLGWGLPNKVVTEEDIRREFKLKPDYKSPEKVIKFFQEVNIGDFVFIYDKDIGEYYLCEVKSNCKQHVYEKEDGKWEKRDIMWSRHAKWKKINRSLLPGKILRNPHIGTISQVSGIKENENMREYLQRIYQNPQKLSRINFKKLKKHVKNMTEKTFFDIVDPDDAEDLTCNIIQSKGWKIIKSMVSASLIGYECHFRRNKKSENTAYVQVKSGDQPLKEKDFEIYEKDAKKDKARIFLFCQNGIDKALINNKIRRQKMTIFDKKQLKEYAEHNLQELSIPLLIKLTLHG